MKPRRYPSQTLLPLGGRADVQWISPEKGFGLIANQDLHPGNVIIDKEKPAIASMNPGPTLRCALCWKGKLPARNKKANLTTGRQMFNQISMPMRNSLLLDYLQG